MKEVLDLSNELPVHPTKEIPKRKTVKRFVVHTTDWVVDPEELAQYDVGPNHISNTGCPSITYHYLIGQDGSISKTANHDWVTWHVGNWNGGSLGIALVYKTDPAFEKAAARGKPITLVNSENRPSGLMLESLTWLLVQLCIHENVSPQKIFGHRELKGTGWFNDKGSKRLRKTCPGMALDMKELRSRVTWKLQETLKDLGEYKGDVDGDFGSMSKSALARAKCHSPLPT